MTAELSPADVTLLQPNILAGVLIGAMMPFFFSSMLFRAVGKCADTIWSQSFQIHRISSQVRNLRTSVNSSPGPFDHLSEDSRSFSCLGLTC